MQWLQRYVELAIGDGDSTADTKAADSPWLDVTWRDRFAEMLQRAEARLAAADTGPIDTLFDASSPTANGCWRTPSRPSPRCWPAIPTPGRRCCILPTCRSSSSCARRWASR